MALAITMYLIHIIALFSNFIPCGVHEGTHILDIFKEDMDMKPDTLHGDTHAQSEVVFGLSKK